jgi:Putative outer membrane beta-barrel porin, MtrB/PioB
VTGAMAADADLPVKAVPLVVEDTPWWTHGFFEVGGRTFISASPFGGHIWQGQGSLAKFYEYSTNKPGPFGDFFITAGSRNGIYEIDTWGYNPGYSDQEYNAYWTKAGEHYLNLNWDQTPHIYSTSASTLFTGIGTNALTLANPNFGSQLHTALGLGPNAAFPPSGSVTAAQGRTISAIVNQNLLPTDIGIRRDTASVDYRYTPTDNWDIKAFYSDMHRTGTQVDSVLFTATNNGSRVDVPKPVNDQTQNFGASGEYIGTSPWGQKINAIVAYNGSIYHDDFNSYTVQNPFCTVLANGTTSCATNTSGTPPTPVAVSSLAQMSTPPSNSMNGVNGTVGMDLPLNSRYMGTVGWTGMNQNAQFLPFSVGPVDLCPNGAGSGNCGPGRLTGAGSLLSSLPAQSLNGQISTLLFNNVVTTQINPDLKTKFGYRYYNYDNQTPQISIADWVITDAVSAKATTVNYAAVNPLMVGYIKQNGVAEADWRPVNNVNIGSAYNYERYDFTRFDAKSTNENSVKVFADWKPERWVTFRGSASFGERRAGDYDYLGNVGMFQWPVPRVTPTVPTGFPNTTNYSPYYRQFYLDDRDRTTAKFQVDVDVLRNLTVTPNLNWRDDEFLLSQNQLGLTHDRSLSAGVEVAYAATPNMRLLFSYLNEQRGQFMYSSSTILAPFNIAPANVAYSCPTPTTCQLYSSNIQDRVNTFLFGVNYAFIPQRLEVGLNYTLAEGRNSSPLIFQNGTGPVAPTLQFPNVNTGYQRLEFMAKYVVDPDAVRNAGIKGDISFRFRYAWERNTVSNWNNDYMMPYMFQVLNQQQVAYYQALAWDNPNYNVHLVGATVAYAW